MDTADSQEKNLHQEVANEASNHLGNPVDPNEVKPVMDQPAVVHEQVKPSHAETPFEDLKEDVLGKKERFADNPGILKVLRRRVSSLMGSDEDSVA